MFVGFCVRIVIQAGNCDNQSTIYLVRNPMFHEHSKHIDVKLHFIREVISSGAIKFDK